MPPTRPLDSQHPAKWKGEYFVEIRGNMLLKSCAVAALLAMAFLLCLSSAVASPCPLHEFEAMVYFENASHTALAQENDSKEERPKVIHLSADVLKRFEGKYTPETPPMVMQRLPDMTYAVDGEGLLLDLGNGSSKHKLLPLSETEFFDDRSPKVRYVFTKNDQGEVTYVTVTGALPTALKANKRPPSKKAE